MPKSFQPTKGPIAKLHDGEQSSMETLLNNIRECARLTNPAILPPRDQVKENPLPQNFQSLGSNGVSGLAGKLMIAAFPPTMPFFSLGLPIDVQLSAEIPDEQKQAMKTELQMEAIRLNTLLESAQAGKNSRRRRPFRTHLFEIIQAYLVTGDALAHMDDDFRMRSFRRDNYTTRRDLFGDVLFHTTREVIDPLSLDDTKYAKSKLPSRDQMEGQMASDRLVDLHTIVEWMPRPTESDNQAGIWKIQQEVNGEVINESEEAVSPYFSFSSGLVSGENYGRGLVELNKGDLSSLDNLEGRLLDYAALATKMHPCIDNGSTYVHEDDLRAPSGTPLRANVQGGQVTDIAYLNVNKNADMNGVFPQIERIERRLGISFMVESSSRRNAERVTTAEIRQDAQELEAGRGGIFSSFVEGQIPMVQKLVQLAQSKGITRATDSTELTISSGLVALANAIEGVKVNNFLQTAAQFGPGVMEHVDMPTALEVLARSSSINEPGLIKSREQVQQEQQQKLQQTAQEQAISSAGRIAETQAASAAA